MALDHACHGVFLVNEPVYQIMLLFLPHQDEFIYMSDCCLTPTEQFFSYITTNL